MKIQLSTCFFWLIINWQTTVSLPAGLCSVRIKLLQLAASWFGFFLRPTGKNCFRLHCEIKLLLNIRNTDPQFYMET